jgi:hypothetical protein
MIRCGKKRRRPSELTSERSRKKSVGKRKRRVEKLSD